MFDQPPSAVARRARERLATAPSRPPDRAAEAAALRDLAHALAAGPARVLDVVCDVVLRTTVAESAGVSLLAERVGDDTRFHRAVVAGACAGRPGDPMASDAGLCGEALRADEPLLFEDPARTFTALGDAEPRIRELLLVPFHEDGRAIGTVWALVHSDGLRFDDEDRRLVATFASFASAAHRSLKIAEAQRDAQARLDLALDNARIVGLWDWDLASRLVFLDARLSRWYGIAPAVGAAGVSSETLLQRVHPDDRAQLRASAVGAAETTSDYADEYRLLVAERTRHLITRGRHAPASDGGPGRLSGLVIDVTELRESRHALEALNASLEARVAERSRALLEAEEALRQSQKMEAVGQLTGGVAHDFNNLLTGIGSSLELMGRRLAQRRVDGLSRYIDLAQGATKKAAALTHRLLAFSRRQPLDPRSVDAKGLVVGMEDMIRRTCPAIELVVEIDHPWPVHVDANQLENAILNLCINACAAMERGGTLRIEGRAHPEDAEWSRARDLVPGDYLELAVADTGTGMSDEVKARAFDPFFTTKPLGEGTGLGLSMVYGFVRQSGGQIEIDTAAGIGTTVRFFLPRSRASAGVETASEQDTVEATTLPRSILVVDDEPTIRMLVSETLAELGHRVVQAGTAADALERAHDGAIDLLVTDVGLAGGMNGRQLADAMRSSVPGLPVLYMTGYAEAMLTRHLDPVAGDEVLMKPFSIDEMTRRVQRMVRASDPEAR